MRRRRSCLPALVVRQQESAGRSRVTASHHPSADARYSRILPRMQDSSAAANGQVVIRPSSLRLERIDLLVRTGIRQVTPRPRRMFFNIVQCHRHDIRFVRVGTGSTEFRCSFRTVASSCATLDAGEAARGYPVGLGQ